MGSLSAAFCNDSHLYHLFPLKNGEQRANENIHGEKGFVERS